ncbi:unnamed protein product [Thelazia callipaeda]|uniref:Copper transport protein n=1 Tax=Thelazia callipaeda TaxID=103827 RepID=A0A0N5D239_THECL|nr:unnamed protein product [Thelazia callipaeda]
MEHHHHHNHINQNIHDNNATDHSGHAHSGHSMSFHFGYNEIVLFEFWVIDSFIGMTITCAITILLCFIMEGIRWFRGVRPPYNVDLHTEQSSVANIKFAPHITSAICTDAFLHAIQLTLSYILMLLFMTFNTWICIATVVGEVFARLTFAVVFSENPINKNNKVDVGCCN